MDEPTASRPQGEPTTFPEAEVRGRRFTNLKHALPKSRWWIVTVICLLIAAVLFWASWSARGTTITVFFREGHGIEPGGKLRHRGIDVGEVTRVELADGLERVKLSIRLESAAESLAREGTRFWIVRPEVSLARIRGLETVIGPNYVALAPGPEDAPAKRIFEGDATPVTVADSRPETIRIHFSNGHGLTVGDELRYRGIGIGEVTAVQLQQDLRGVTVEVRLSSSAADVARGGSQFWVERPRVGLSGIGGLETLVGGRYLSVLPGPAKGPPVSEFQGLDVAPVALERLPGGLEIVLESPARFGVEGGAPLVYRGVEIGKVLSVQLAGDAASVESRAYVYPAYKSLIRDNTRFWSTSGVDLRVGVSGIHFTADSLATILAGGVALATPNEAGKPASTGHRFALERASGDVEQWREWQPRLALGDIRLPEGASLPEPHRGLLRWQRRTLGIRRTQQREGWYLILEGRQVLAPADLLLAPKNAEETPRILELAGQEIPVSSEQVTQEGLLAKVNVSGNAAGQLNSGWPASAMRSPREPEDCLIVGASRQQHTPLTAARLNKENDYWIIDPSLPLAADAHGAPVVATRDGAVIGVVVIRSEDRVVALLPDSWTPAQH